MFSSNIFLVGINKLLLNSSVHWLDSQILATWLFDSVKLLLNKSKPKGLLLTEGSEPLINWRVLFVNCQTESKTLILPFVEFAK